MLNSYSNKSGFICFTTLLIFVGVVHSEGICPSKSHCQELNGESKEVLTLLCQWSNTATGTQRTSILEDTQNATG